MDSACPDKATRHSPGGLTVRRCAAAAAGRGCGGIGAYMFFTYLRRELRRRMRQAVFISLGLALGVGLVITVTAASDGVQNSQTSVLHSLYGVGTDVTVTQPPKSGGGHGDHQAD